jgi:recombination protein RecT
MTQVDKAKELASKTQIVTVQDFITKKKDLIARVLPKAITPERLLGIFEMILNSSPKLKECSQKSLIGAVIQTAQLGLQPGNIGHIHLIPFNNKGVLECQLIIGYRGYVELVNRSKEATILSAEVVYEKDQFQYEQGLNPILRHIPAGGDRGEKIGVYCIAKNLLANEKVFVYLQKEDVEKIKAASKSASSDYSPWSTWPDEMWKKSAVKRITKYLPLSAESEKAISADETIKTEITPDMTEVKDVTDWQGQEPIDVPAQKEPEVDPNAYKQMLDNFAKAKVKLGPKLYYKVLGETFGLEHANQIHNMQLADQILKEMHKQYEANK